MRYYCNRRAREMRTIAPQRMLTTSVGALGFYSSILRLAFVAKCGQAFGKVFAADMPGESIKLRLKPVIRIRVESGARERFDLGKHLRTLPGELQGGVLGAREQLRRGYDFVDQAPI